MITRRPPHTLSQWLTQTGKRGESLALVDFCHGHYVCPKDSSGKRLGPLVAYRGKDELGRHYVGDEYVNFAAVEEYSSIMRRLARDLQQKIRQAMTEFSITVFCGAPEGGKSPANFLAAEDGQYGKRFVFPEKKGKKILWGRHRPRPGDRVLLVEDTCHNFRASHQPYFRSPS